MEHMGECLRAVSEELSLIKCNGYWSKGSTSSCTQVWAEAQEAKEYLLTLLMISRGFGLNRELGGLRLFVACWSTSDWMKLTTQVISQVLIICVELIYFRLDEVDNAGL